MAVEEEVYDLEAINADLKIIKRKTCITRMKRGKNGYWTLTLDVEIEVMMPDGRVVTAWPEVEIPARQSGKRPGNPDPFGHRKRQAAMIENDIKKA